MPAQTGFHNHLDSDRVILALSEERGLSPETVERGLYADLPSEEKLSSVPDWSPELLVSEYERAERQAVLLRAVRIVADVRHASAHGYRALFGKRAQVNDAHDRYANIGKPSGS